MKLIRLRLKNFRLHRNLELDFKDGVNAIIGSNGRGKSSILEAIQFLFTGEIDERSKSLVITTGEVSGHVYGEFELNGKVGYIERHLDVTKVILKYDGKEYLKSIQVKEQWENLLQISPDIFNKVIIAKQGEIPLLFTGDSNIRSNIFQKIFMVPNVGKIKDLIWMEYIKKLPPLFPIEDEDKLQQDINDKIDKIALTEIELNKYKNVTVEELLKFQNIVNEIRLVIANNKQIESLSSKNIEFKSSIDNFNKLIRDLQKEIKNSPLTKDEVSKVIKDNFESKLNEIKILKNQLQEYSIFDNKQACPTCGQHITDITLLIKTLEKQIIDVNYDKEDHEDYSELYNKLLALEKQIKSYQDEIVDLKKNIVNNTKIIKSLENKDYLDVNFDNSLAAAEDALQLIQEELEVKKTLELQINSFKTEINGFKRRIAEDRVNKEKNEKRNELEKVLLNLYDAFHPTQFTKRIIQKYSSIVTDYLLENLSKFNIPYSCSIGDDFNVYVIDRNGREVPSVSGGQKVMIGMCLRLALLQLFAQNFSFFIIDEATQSLDIANQELYFELVKNLKKSQWKQIILIDHSEKLASVVDHTIDLGRD